MSKRVKIGSVLLMIVWLASFAAAVQKPAVQPAGPMNQLLNSAQDVITASDAGGGYLTTGDIILVVVIIFAVIGLIAVLAR
jgi:hypothetical protein